MPEHAQGEAIHVALKRSNEARDGRALARWALLQALECDLKKLTVEVVAEQEGAVSMFGGLGFQAEGLLRDHVRDRDGELRDLILLSHSVEDAWSAMETAGIDDALA